MNKTAGAWSSRADIMLERTSQLYALSVLPPRTKSLFTQWDWARLDVVERTFFPLLRIEPCHPTRSQSLLLTAIPAHIFLIVEVIIRKTCGKVSDKEIPKRGFTW